MKNQQHTPVLIVGAGGAGLSLSLLLQQQGIASVLIERRSDVSWYPRARNLNFRSLEILRGLGLSSEAHAVGARPSRLIRKESLASRQQEEVLDPITLFEGAFEDITPEPVVWYCPQSRLEPLLLTHARRRDIDVRYNTELVSFTQDDTAVTVTLQDRTTGRREVLSFDYLLAADGAHSKVREKLGLPGKGYGALEEYFLFIYFRANWRQFMQENESAGDVLLIENSTVNALFMRAEKDLGMLTIRYRPAQGQSAEVYTRERCQDLLRAAIGDPNIPFELLDISPWRAAEHVADQFQQGRVFLVGDAAHTMPPYEGLGVNMALQGAQNLVWKLAATIKGQASPELLSTYTTERHPVTWMAAEQSLAGMMERPELKQHSLFARTEEERAKLAKQPPAPLFVPILGYRYRSDAIVSEEAVPPSQQGIELLGSMELNGQPGTRVPHLWVERSGQRLSTLDLFDGSFVLFTGSGGASWCEAASAVAEKLGIKLSAYRIGPSWDLLDVENGWHKLGISPEGVMLARPDGFVAWRHSDSVANHEEQLQQVLLRILGRATAQPAL
ncbi:FAD-dependent monooxygenase [Ktedonosporobacter rubrisoli]|nr:FAD-dependent monooxygenase [Ktedonosporobacter rubrisoli]